MPPPNDPLPASSTSTMPAVTPSQTLYFAYGSNLSPTQMHTRCPSSPLIGAARLSQARWFINSRGYANVVPLPPSGQLPASEPNIVQHPPESNLLQTNPGLTPSDLRAGLDAQPDADAQPDENTVYGLVYALSPSDEVRLDGFEGVPSAYGKEWRDVQFWPLETDPDAGVRGDSADVREASALEADLLAAADPFGPVASRAGTKAVRLPRGRARVEGPGATVRALVYVDRSRLELGVIQHEYVLRMRRGMLEAAERGLPSGWMDRVIGRGIGAGAGS